MAELKHSDRDAEANQLAEDWWRYKTAFLDRLPEHELTACRKAFYAGAAIGEIRALARVRAGIAASAYPPQGG